MAQAWDIKTHFTSVGPMQLCMLARLGCRYFLVLEILIYDPLILERIHKHAEHSFFLNN